MSTTEKSFLWCGGCDNTHAPDEVFRARGPCPMCGWALIPADFEGGASDEQLGAIVDRYGPDYDKPVYPDKAVSL